MHSLRSQKNGNNVYNKDITNFNSTKSNIIFSSTRNDVKLKNKHKKIEEEY